MLAVVYGPQGNAMETVELAVIGERVERHKEEKKLLGISSVMLLRVQSLF